MDYTVDSARRNYIVLRVERDGECREAVKSGANFSCQCQCVYNI